MLKKGFSLLILSALMSSTSSAFSRYDTLRGSNGTGRNWWKVLHYDLAVNFMKDSISNHDITGVCKIEFQVLKDASDSMQIDLQYPLTISEITLNGVNGVADTRLRYERDSNVTWVMLPNSGLKAGDTRTITIKYSGKPRKAVNPPWDGGFSWKTHGSGTPWVAVSCQGLGASVWWPCKDYQAEEPTNGVSLHYSVPEQLVAVGNGRLKNVDEQGSTHTKVFNWEVKNPINTYDVTFYIGDYVTWHDTLNGEKGTLDLDYYVLRENSDTAHRQFKVVPQMLHCFEYWMGPYPFYEDGYKLVDAPYLGMEHQSAVAYGNNYKMGYMGFDRTGTGVGMNFDYIIVHETGHEWFGNSVTAGDIADNWIHEGITTFSETLFAECLLNKKQAEIYNRGEWNGIRNNIPIIGPKGVNTEGSGDMYDKGTAIMQMIRNEMNDDERFRVLLRGLSAIFYHKITNSQEVEQFIEEKSGLHLQPFFNQYLRTADIPQLNYYKKKKVLRYKFTNVVEGFTLPITMSIKNGEVRTIYPTKDWQEIKIPKKAKVSFGNNYLIDVQ